MDYKGGSNLEELSLCLHRSLMLRRLKADVLHWLPPKIRKQIFLPIAAASVCSLSPQALEEQAERPGSEAMQLWADASTKKMPAMKQYLWELLEQADRKILLFAHFRATLDAFEEWLMAERIGHVKIDGTTPTSQRQAICSHFQESLQIRVALLSITAASSGLTFTSASVVVVAELYWNPGTLLQAEDRAHRIGQADCVNVHYLLGQGTFDDHLWPLLLKKLKTLKSIGMASTLFEDEVINKQFQ